MKKLNIIIALYFITSFNSVFGQKIPSLIIDSTAIQFTEVSMPYWLKSGQRVRLGENSKSVSILEFTVNGTTLEFSKVVSLTSSQTVPANKAWKIEGIGINKIDTNTSIGTTLSGFSSTSTSANLPILYQSPIKYQDAGTFTWKVPPGVNVICIEVWGGGGGGQNVGANQNSGGGGGGGYGYGCFNVVSGTTYSITVGSGGSGLISGGASSVGSLIIATGGSPGGLSTNCTSASGGIGGSSNAAYFLVGETGGIGIGCPTNTLGCGGNGGKSPNGGAGGNGGCTFSNGSSGNFPGGGGGGTWTAPQVNNTPRVGGSGARGQVIIYF